MKFSRIKQEKPTCTDERPICDHLVSLTTHGDPNIQECTTHGCIHGRHLKYVRFTSSSFGLQMS
jgi:hypothetical protein